MTKKKDTSGYTSHRVRIPLMLTYSQLCKEVKPGVLDEFNCFVLNGGKIRALPSDENGQEFDFTLLDSKDELLAKILPGYSVYLNDDLSFTLPTEAKTFVHPMYDAPDYGKYGLGEQYDEMIDNFLNIFNGQESNRIRSNMIASVLNGLLAGGHTSFKDVVNDAFEIVELLEQKLSGSVNTQ